MLNGKSEKLYSQAFLQQYVSGHGGISLNIFISFHMFTEGDPSAIVDFQGALYVK